MQVFWRTWGDEFDAHDRKTRSAGTAVIVKDDHGREFMSFAVPSPFVAQTVRDLLKVYLEEYTPHQLRQLVEQIGQFNFYQALHDTQFVTVSEEEE